MIFTMKRRAAVSLLLSSLVFFKVPHEPPEKKSREWQWPHHSCASTAGI